MQQLRSDYTTIHELIKEQTRRHRWNIWYLQCALECDVPILEAYDVHAQSLVVAGEEETAVDLFYCHIDDLQNKQLAPFDSSNMYQFLAGPIRPYTSPSGSVGYGFIVVTPRVSQVYVRVENGQIFVGGSSPAERTALQARNFDTDVAQLVATMLCPIGASSFGAFIGYSSVTIQRPLW